MIIKQLPSIHAPTHFSGTLGAHLLAALIHLDVVGTVGGLDVGPAVLAGRGQRGPQAQARHHHQQC